MSQTFSLPLSLLISVLLAESIEAQRPGDGRRDRPRVMRMLPVMQVLDRNKDGEIDGDEIARAGTSLLELDANGDGNLVDDELMPDFGRRDRRRPTGAAPGDRRPAREPGGERQASPSRGPGGPMEMMREMVMAAPLMKRLDLDGDGALFEDEVTDAAKALVKLDGDGDGVLRGEELEQRFGRSRRGSRPQRGARTLEPTELEIRDGTATIPDRETFATLSYRGEEVMIDTHLTGLEYVKFQIEGALTDSPTIYFINTNTHRAHMMFMSAAGLPRSYDGQMRGVLVYRPMLEAPNGANGLFTFEFEPNDAYEFEMIQLAFDLLGEHSALMRGRLAYHLLPLAKQQYLKEVDKYEQAGLPVFDESDKYGEIAFLPLHCAASFGRLRIMRPDERPSPRDVVLYDAIPNEMPRVAGIITGVPQTPLSHVNLRAVQDDVPNAFIAGASRLPEVRELVGKYVAYRVTEDGYSIREATQAQVEAHFAGLRPTQAQVPPRDLGVKEIRPLDSVGFGDAAVFGVKATNLATLRSFGLRDDLVPDGFAVPFSFYDSFMRHNDLYSKARAMLGTTSFQDDADVRAKQLKKFRRAIKKAEMPDWMAAALDEVQQRFPAGSSIRCRSSTNNEDLPGFSGAGLYSSFTHRPEEGALAKSIKQVFASLWNFRAFEEREFYRIDHFGAAMGVLLHRNQRDEIANGVVVTKDVLYQTRQEGKVLYYLNVQEGEDLVTNPEEASVPEEILLAPRNPAADRVVRRSNRTENGEPILSDGHLLELRRAMRVVHQRFAELYGRVDDPDFAMEAEFKVTKDGRLLIKQARPWID